MVIIRMANSTPTNNDERSLLSTRSVRSYQWLIYERVEIVYRWIEATTKIYQHLNEKGGTPVCMKRKKKILWMNWGHQWWCIWKDTSKPYLLSCPLRGQKVKKNLKVEEHLHSMNHALEIDTSKKRRYYLSQLGGIRVCNEQRTVLHFVDEGSNRTHRISIFPMVQSTLKGNTHRSERKSLRAF